MPPETGRSAPSDRHPLALLALIVSALPWLALPLCPAPLFTRLRAECGSAHAAHACAMQAASPQERHHWLQLAATRGHQLSRYLLAKGYLQNALLAGRTGQCAAARRSAEQAAACGSTTGLQLYVFGAGGDPARGRALALAQLADGSCVEPHGLDETRVLLGWMFARGYGGDVDLAQARNLYRLAGVSRNATVARRAQNALRALPR